MVKKASTKTTKGGAVTAKTMQDFKSAVLVISVIINLMVFIGWLVIKVTSKYDEQVAQFLFGN
jgi:hypothetical protein